MQILEKILVANDFSEASGNVLKNAIEFAKVFHSKVSLLHVLPDDLEEGKVKRLLYESATKKLEEAADRIKAEGIEVGEPLLKYGSAYDQIALAADQQDVNLVIVGAGEGGAENKYPLGTNALRVIQKSEQPVFVVKEGVPLQVKRILCPVDLSKTSKRALKNAIIMARRFGAELLILHVVESRSAGWLSSEEDLRKENNKRYDEQQAKLKEFLSDVNLADLRCRQEIRLGDPSTLILETLEEQREDLLVMGTSGKTGLSRMIMGSVAEKVAREVPCSFVMLKSEDVIQLQLESRLRDLENHFHIAQQLVEDGFLEEAIGEYKKCLLVNSMHLPSYYGIAKAYDKMGNPQQAEVYRKNGKEILHRIWDKKIEEEIRSFYSR